MLFNNFSNPYRRVELFLFKTRPWFLPCEVVLTICLDSVTPDSCEKLLLETPTEGY